MPLPEFFACLIVSIVAAFAATQFVKNRTKTDRTYMAASALFGGVFSGAIWLVS